MGDFEGSETVPVMSAEELRACAKAEEAPKLRAMIKQKTLMSCLSI
jgi:hypothetical protein